MSTPDRESKADKARQPDRPAKHPSSEPPRRGEPPSKQPDSPAHARPQAANRPHGFSDTDGETADFESHADGEDF